jgi:F-type H+-transporting ATPase subunit a
MNKRWISTWALLVALTLIAVPTVGWATGNLPSQNAKVVAAGEESSSEGGKATEEKADPMEEFALPRIGPKLMVGPIDMSINKAVIYLLLSALITVGWALYMARRLELKPNRKQTFTETFYEFAYDQIAKQTLGHKVFSRYMPYVASLFMFLWVVNMLSFIPLPLGNEHIGDSNIKTLGLYAATSNINVTLALTLVTFLLTHYEGIKHNGVKKYFGSWAPPGKMGPVIWPLHAMSEILRLVSLSVRLFANMLAGHLLILMMLSLISIIGVIFVAVGTVPVALFFFLFEFVLVASLQAFIFAMLSGIYIGFAAEPAH